MAIRVAPLLLLLLQLALMQPRLHAGEVTCQSFHSCSHPYVVVLDAGSTSTKLYVFRFRRTNNATGAAKIRVLREKRETAKPGLASFANFPQRIHCHLQPLIKFAMALVPAESHAGTAIVLGATAGVRQLPFDRVRAIVRASAASLRRTPFNAVNLTDHALAMVLSGKEEGSFAWVGVNFLMDRFEGNVTNATNGVLELGGGSTQVAVLSPNTSIPDGSTSYTVEHSYWIKPADVPLHLNSYQGLGKSAATLKMLGYSASNRMPEYTSPCLHPEVRLNVFSFDAVSINVSGDAATPNGKRWLACQAKARAALKEVPVLQAPRVDRYIVISGFFYVIKSLSKKPESGALSTALFSLHDLADAAKQACQNPPKTGKYDIYLCLDAAYIVTLLRDGYQLADSQLFTAKNSVGKFSFGWPIGLAATYVKEPCFIGSPALGYFQKRWAAAKIGGRK